MTYTATLSSTLAKLSTLKEKSKYTRYIMDLYVLKKKLFIMHCLVYSRQRFFFRRSIISSGL